MSKTFRAGLSYSKTEIASELVEYLNDEIWDSLGRHFTDEESNAIRRWIERRITDQLAQTWVDESATTLMGEGDVDDRESEISSINDDLLLRIGFRSPPTIAKRDDAFTVAVITNEDGESEIWTGKGVVDQDDIIAEWLKDFNEELPKKERLTRKQFDDRYNFDCDVRYFHDLT